MDEALLKQLTRQLKILNLWITFFGTIIVIALVTLGILLYQVISFTHRISDRVDSTQQSLKDNLDVKQKVCDNSSVTSVVNRYTDVCK
ncbi:MAG: hypothetical protein JWM37_173 [Candidatus Saccharibacteria bacterium]|nr:hypothetical protein [Candidatus Saccharibacteria bacterium]